MYDKAMLEIHWWRILCFPWIGPYIDVTFPESSELDENEHKAVSSVYTKRSCLQYQHGFQSLPASSQNERLGHMMQSHGDNCTNIKGPSLFACL